MLILLLWILVGWTALGAIASIMMIGRDRQPLTPGVATASVILAVGIILVLLWAISEVPA